MVPALEPERLVGQRLFERAKGECLPPSGPAVAGRNSPIAREDRETFDRCRLLRAVRNPAADTKQGIALGQFDDPGCLQTAGQATRRFSAEEVLVGHDTPYRPVRRGFASQCLGKPGVESSFSDSFEDDCSIGVPLPAGNPRHAAGIAIQFQSNFHRCAVQTPPGLPPER